MSTTTPTVSLAGLNPNSMYPKVRQGLLTLIGFLALSTTTLAAFRMINYPVLYVLLTLIAGGLTLVPIALRIIFFLIKRPLVLSKLGLELAWLALLSAIWTAAAIVGFVQDSIDRCATRSRCPRGITTFYHGDQPYRARQNDFDSPTIPILSIVNAFVCLLFFVVFLRCALEVRSKLRTQAKSGLTISGKPTSIWNASVKEFDWDIVIWSGHAVYPPTAAIGSTGVAHPGYGHPVGQYTPIGRNADAPVYPYPPQANVDEERLHQTPTQYTEPLLGPIPSQNGYKQ